MNPATWNQTPLRTFDLVRNVDVTGVSGTGTIARGAQFPDGTIVMQWTPPRSSLAIHPNLDTMLAIHGHQGATVVHWT